MICACGTVGDAWPTDRFLIRHRRAPEHTECAAPPIHSRMAARKPHGCAGQVCRRGQKCSRRAYLRAYLRTAPPARRRGGALAAFDRATMNAGELAQDRSHRDAALRRLVEGGLQFRGPGSGLTGKARVDQCLAARLRTGSRCRTTQSQHHRQRRQYSKQESLHGEPPFGGSHSTLCLAAMQVQRHVNRRSLGPGCGYVPGT